MCSLRRGARAALLVTLCLLAGAACGSSARPTGPQGAAAELERGRYLATIGVCEACHTPPRVSEVPPTSAQAVHAELQFRTDPDWFRYLDPDRRMAGGVPFILRFGPDSHAVVYSRNISPDDATGLGRWTIDEIVTALRTGRRKTGELLTLFAPHTFFKDLAVADAVAIARYLKSLPPIPHQVPASTPLPGSPMIPGDLEIAPEGRTPARGAYLLRAVVGCRECHSYHDRAGVLQEFVGGDPRDPFIGVFRLGPDLPLRPLERGFATFPYPGFSILYASNLTRFGRGGDLADVSAEAIARTIRSGVDVEHDPYGRPELLAHVMMWQFYRQLAPVDALAIADRLKALQYVDHHVAPRLVHYGTDWAAMFEAIFGGPPSPADRAAFGK